MNYTYRADLMTAGSGLSMLADNLTSSSSCSSLKTGASCSLNFTMSVRESRWGWEDASSSTSD